MFGTENFHGNLSLTLYHKVSDVAFSFSFKVCKNYFALPKPACCRGATREISQPQRGWIARIIEDVLKGRWKREDLQRPFRTCRSFPRFQPLRGWLISKVPWRQSMPGKIISASSSVGRFVPAN